MPDEQIDIFDEEGTKIGVEWKSEAHKKGLWHLSVHIWIFNSQGQMLLQKRAMIKKSYPGLWDIAAAGHVPAGEIPDQAALRELEEELGIKAGRLEKINIRKEQHAIPEKDWDNREITYEYLFKFDGDISQLKLQEEEVEKVRFFDLDELENEIRNPETYSKFVPHELGVFLDIIEIVRKLS